MQDEIPNKRLEADTQRRDWSDDEKARLRELAPKATRKNQLRELFPGRSLAAIKVMLCKTRRELDLPKRGNTAKLNPTIKLTILPKDAAADPTPSWQEAQRPALERASAQYLAALQAAA